MPTPQRNDLIAHLLQRAENESDDPLYYFLDSRGREYAQLTYGNLLSAVQHLGQWICAKTSVNDRVAIQLPTSPEFIISFFACIYSNRIPVPLSSPTRKHTCEHYHRIFDDCDARLVITEDKIKALYDKDGDINQRSILNFPDLKAFEPLLAPIENVDNNIAFLQYTSGSTSFPKGVMVSHKNIMANQKMIQRTFGHQRTSIGLGWIPLFHDMGLIGSIFQPLTVGFPCYLMTPTTFLQRPKIWLKTISDKKVTTTGGPNFAYDVCVKRIVPETIEGLSLSSWEVAYNGAEQVKLNTLEEFSQTFAPFGFKKSAFLPCYGLAEATLIVSGVDKTKEPSAFTIPTQVENVLAPEATSTGNGSRTVVDCGQIMPELTVRIINPKTLEDCPSHHIGEVWIAGPSVTTGYWEKPKKNWETFVYRDNLRFLRTGDLGFVDSHNKLYVTGRLKELMVIEGKNYYPQDIEETVKQSHPALNMVNCAVFTIPSVHTQKLVVVSEVERQFRQHIHQHVQDIKEAVKISVHNYHQLMVHDTILLSSNTIPKTTSGKTQRQLTKLLYLQEELCSLETVAG